MNDILTITITGPRGCGKTTIAQALRTILVEQYGQNASFGGGHRLTLAELPHALFDKKIPILIVDPPHPKEAK